MVIEEPATISVELAREGIKNPVLAGTLFGHIRKHDCRVRLKEDSIVIKLRKDKPGKWHSILDKPSTDLKMATPENRIHPVAADRQFIEEERAPIEPSFAAAPVIATEVRQESNMRSLDEEIAQENHAIKGVLDSMKAFHESVFGGFEKQPNSPAAANTQIMPTNSGFGVELYAETKDSDRAFAVSE